MRLRLLSVWLAALFFALLILVISCSTSQAPRPQIHFGGTPSWAYALAGSATNSSVLFAMVTNQYGLLVAYACDGRQVVEWFEGPLQGTIANVVNSDGSSFAAMLTALGAQITLTLKGEQSLRFQITLATKPAGLYQTKQEVNGNVYLAGWVLLPDGRQAGMIQTGDQHYPAPRLDPVRPTVLLPDGATLTPQFVTPESTF